MTSKIASESAVAKDSAIYGDEARLLGETTDDVAKDSAVTLTIVIQRGNTFVQQDKGWSNVPEDGTPTVELRGRFAQYFRFKEAKLQCAGKISDFPNGAPTEDSKWFDVKGYPGVMTVTGIDGSVKKYFTIENATRDLWPPIRVGTYPGRMELFKEKNAIFVAPPGKLIHRVAGPAGYPSYVCGCVIPGIYDDAVNVDDVRSVNRSGEALDAIIESLGGFSTTYNFTVTVK